MFKKRTLFVVGAGASAEFGLPVGAQLASIISKKLNILYDDVGRTLKAGDTDLWAQFHYNFRQEGREYQEAAWLIRDGILLSSSIDDFLDVHHQNDRAVTVGKTAIVKSILEAERNSSLYFNRSNIYNKMNLSNLEGTWIIKFIRLLGRGIPLQRVETIFENVAFIVFNYDRCIEHFLLEALRQLYDIKAQDAAAIMGSLRIVHPYGIVANLPFLGSESVPFGGDADALSAPYLKLSKKIRTYTERIGENGEVERIREEVERAEKIVFLGFAFHDQNIQLIKPEKEMTRKRIFGSAFGMSSSDVDVVRAQLISFFDRRARATMADNIVLESSHKCSDVFDHYAKSLPA